MLNCLKQLIKSHVWGTEEQCSAPRFSTVQEKTAWSCSNRTCRDIYSRVLPAVLLVFLLFTGGCGKKVWPEPDASAEEFTLTISQYQFEANCLIIQGGIEGKAENLAGIILELEETSSPCPACPFKLSSSAEYDPGTPGYSRDRDSFTLRYCGLSREKYYRARLRGKNVYSVIKDTRSRVKILDRE